MECCGLTSQSLDSKHSVTTNLMDQYVSNYIYSFHLPIRIFSANETVSCDDLLYKLHPILFGPPTFGHTEDSCHAFWDAIIKWPLQIFCPRMDFDRNTNRGTSTGNDPTLAEMCSNKQCIPEYRVLNRQNGIIVDISSKFVTKKYGYSIPRLNRYDDSISCSYSCRI